MMPGPSPSVHGALKKKSRTVYKGAMGGPRTAVVVALLLAGAQANAADSLLFLGSPAQSEAADREVVEAATIYTRDLGVTIRVLTRAAPVVVSPQGVADVAALARAAGARLAFWFAPRAHAMGVSGAILYTVGRDGVQDTHALPVPGPDGPELHRAIGLKLRAVLTGAPIAGPTVPMPRPAPTTGAASRPDRAPAPTASAPAPGAATTAAQVPPGRDREVRVRLGTGYWLTVPASGTHLRQGVAIEASVQPHPLVEAHLGLDVTTKVEATATTGVATLLDLPVRAGARLVLHRARLTLGLGPLVSLPVLSAHGLATDGTSGRSTKVAAGLGASAVVRYELWRRVSVGVRLLFERTLPHTRFLIDQTPAIDDGTWLVGLGVGVSFVAR